MSECLRDAYDRITGGGIFGKRIFQRGGFEAPTLRRGGTTIFFESPPFGFRSNDDTFDIISDVPLRVTLSVEGTGVEPGGLHPDHFPRLALTEYTVRIIGDSTGVNPTIVDAYQSDLGAPPLYAGYDKSRIVYKMVTTNSTNLFSMSIFQIGNAWRTYYGAQDNNLTIGENLTADTPTVISCAALVPIGIKSIAILALDFQTGLGGTIGDSLNVLSDAGQLTGNIDSYKIHMPEVLLNDFIRIRQDVSLNGASSMKYQVTDSVNNLANIYCYGHERTIGGDD